MAADLNVEGITAFSSAIFRFSVTDSADFAAGAEGFAAAAAGAGGAASVFAGTAEGLTLKRFGSSDAIRSCRRLPVRFFNSTGSTAATTAASGSETFISLFSSAGLARCCRETPASR